MSHEQFEQLSENEQTLERLIEERKKLFEGLTSKYISDHKKELEEKFLLLDQEIAERTNAIARGDGPVSIRVTKPNIPPQKQYMDIHRYKKS